MCDAPCRDVLIFDVASSDDPTISILVNRLAGDGFAGDMVCEGEGGFATARPALPLKRRTGLTAFDSIDGEEADAGSVDFDCIAIDHGGASDDVLRDRWRDGGGCGQEHGKERAWAAQMYLPKKQAVPIAESDQWFERFRYHFVPSFCG